MSHSKASHTVALRSQGFDWWFVCRDLWKMCAWRMSEDPRLPLFARATIAAHCGNLKVILMGCTTWADVLWGHLRCVVDVRVEREIRSQIHRTYIDMPEEYWQNE